MLLCILNQTSIRQRQQILCPHRQSHTSPRIQRRQRSQRIRLLRRTVQIVGRRVEQLLVHIHLRRRRIHLHNLLDGTRRKPKRLERRRLEAQRRQVDQLRRGLRLRRQAWQQVV